MLIIIPIPPSTTYNIHTKTIEIHLNHLNILEENTHLVKKSNETFVFYLKNLKTSSGGCSISKLEIYCFWNWKEKPDYKVHDSTVKEISGWSAFAQYNIRRKIVENKHKNNIKNTLAIVEIYKAELYHKIWKQNNCIYIYLQNVTWQKK